MTAAAQTTTLILSPTTTVSKHYTTSRRNLHKHKSDTKHLLSKQKAIYLMLQLPKKIQFPTLKKLLIHQHAVKKAVKY